MCLRHLRAAGGAFHGGDVFARAHTTAWCCSRTQPALFRPPDSGLDYSCVADALLANPAKLHCTRDGTALWRQLDEGAHLRFDPCEHRVLTAYA